MNGNANYPENLHVPERGIVSYGMSSSFWILVMTLMWLVLARIFVFNRLFGFLPFIQKYIIAKCFKTPGPLVEPDVEEFPLVDVPRSTAKKNRKENLKKLLKPPRPPVVVVVDDEEEKSELQLPSNEFLAAKFCKYFWHCVVYMGFCVWNFRMLNTFRVSVSQNAWKFSALVPPHMQDWKYEIPPDYTFEAGFLPTNTISKSGEGPAFELDEVFLFYCLQCAWYLAGLFDYCIYDRSRSDFGMMVAHHALTIALIYGSLQSHAHRIGLHVMGCLDIADVVMYMSKMIHLVTSTREGKCRPGRLLDDSRKVVESENTTEKKMHRGTTTSVVGTLTKDLDELEDYVDQQQSYLARLTPTFNTIQTATLCWLLTVWVLSRCLVYGRIVFEIGRYYGILGGLLSHIGEILGHEFPQMEARIDHNNNFTLVYVFCSYALLLMLVLQVTWAVFICRMCIKQVFVGSFDDDLSGDLRLEKKKNIDHLKRRYITTKTGGNYSETQQEKEKQPTTTTTKTTSCAETEKPGFLLQLSLRRRKERC